MKFFYAFIIILAIFNTINNIYRGNYGLALVNIVCSLMCFIDMMSLIKRESREKYITIKELMEREEI